MDMIQPNNEILNLKIVNESILQNIQIRNSMSKIQNVANQIKKDSANVEQNINQMINSQQFHQLIEDFKQLNIQFQLNYSQTNLFPQQKIYFNQFFHKQGLFSLALIIIPKGLEFSLHDHRNMLVLTKILYGQLEIQSMDIDEEYTKIAKSLRIQSIQRRKYSMLRKKTSKKDNQKVSNNENDMGSSSHLINLLGSQSSDLDEKTKLYENFMNPNYYKVKNWKKTVLKNSNIQILSPKNGNIHGFVAKTNCILIDILFPDYESQYDCNFYQHVSNPNSKYQFINKIRSPKEQTHLRDINELY